MKRDGLLFALTVPAYLPWTLLVHGVFERIALLVNPDFLAMDPHHREEVYFLPVLLVTLAVSLLSLIAALRFRPSKLRLLPLALNTATLLFFGYALITFAFESS